MNSNYPLLFTPKAQPGESPLSVLRRGALGNGHRSTLRFAYALNASLDHSPTALGTLARNPDIFRETCQSMGLMEDEIGQVSYQRAGAAREDDLVWQGLRVRVGDLQFQRSKLCMACYQELGYARAEWDHVSAIACARHGVLLDDACPCCSAPWTYLEDPHICGCATEKVTQAQQPCDTKAATLLSRIIETADQPGIQLLGKLRAVVDTWVQFGLQLSKAMIADALSALYSGYWPAPLENSAAGLADSLHPRVALASLVADENPKHRRHAHLLLKRRAPAFPVSVHNDLQWPATTAAAVLGIGRVPFDKLIADGHLAIDQQKRVSALAVNALLQQIASTGYPSMVGTPLQNWRSGRQRQSLSCLIADIKAGVVEGTGCGAIKGLDGLHHSAQSRITANLTDDLTTIADAALRLHTNTESVRGVIHAGLLPARQGTPGSGVRWSIDPAGLVAFDHNYVFASALAKQYLASRTTLASRLRSVGLSPVSGPGIDGGFTYLFRRDDLRPIDMATVLTGPYQSPAGRKMKSVSTTTKSSVFTASELATLLNVQNRQLRQLIRDRWIEPLNVQARTLSFDRATATSLAERLAADYREISIAAKTTAQTVPAFRRTWIMTGFARVNRFGNRELITVADLERIESIWIEARSSSAIGSELGRTRSLCPNLQKMGELKPIRILGSGNKKIRLYPRNAEPLSRFQIWQA